MAKYHDIKLKDYVFSPRFKNSDFGQYIALSDDYTVSSDPVTASHEKAYFAMKKYEDIDSKKQFPSQEYIFTLETSLQDVLLRMEMEWFLLDSKKLSSIWEEISKKIRLLEVEIYEVVWESFNINSTKQLQQILFEKLNIPVSKKIKTWFSVDNEALESIWQKYPVALMILEHRSLRKLQTTYVDWLLKSINPDTKKIHTSFNQTQTSTWRLSSENPNLQNIPAWDWYAEMIKSCFIPSKDDFKLLVADYSQVELRVLANLSGDPVLLWAFIENEDIHARTARYLFWVDGKVTSEQRRRAKTVNFWVVYWISWFGLSKQISSWMQEANEYIEKFYDTYKGVREYYDSLLEKARAVWYVETLFWRRRYILWLNDANRIIRWQAEREAINMPIQWTAADIIKIAMVRIDEMISEKNYKSKMILQVHDELVFEIHKDEPQFEMEIKEIMENVYNFEAKLLVETWIWENWKKAKG